MGIEDNMPEKLDSHYIGIGMALGAGVGVAIGTAIGHRSISTSGAIPSFSTFHSPSLWRRASSRWSNTR